MTWTHEYEERQKSPARIEREKRRKLKQQKLQAEIRKMKREHPEMTRSQIKSILSQSQE